MISESICPNAGLKSSIAAHEYTYAAFRSPELVPDEPLDAVSQHQGGSRPPELQSWAARVGVLVLVCLSIYVGARYWWERDQPLAVLTIGAELIAFAGLGVAAWQWGRCRRLAAGALLVTVIAAAWCAFTMYQKIEADGRAEAIDAAKERPAYVFAENAARTATSLLTERLRRPNPRPDCTCPQTIAAWEAAEASAIDRLRYERDTSVRQMEAAIPVPEIDRLALARGIGVEIAKLFGFVVFTLALGPARRGQSVLQPTQPFEVVYGGRSTSPPTISRPKQPDAQPARRPSSLSLKNLANLAFGWFAANATQPTLNHYATSITTPVNQPVDTVVERNAAPMRWDELGKVARELGASMSERQIAAQMSTRYGEKISRHQVRIWLGRERSAPCNSIEGCLGGPATAAVL